MSENRVTLDTGCGELKVFEPHPTISVEPARITPAGIQDSFIVARFPREKADFTIVFDPGDMTEPLRIAQLLMEAVDQLVQENQKCPFNL